MAVKKIFASASGVALGSTDPLYSFEGILEYPQKLWPKRQKKIFFIVVLVAVALAVTAAIAAVSAATSAAVPVPVVVVVVVDAAATVAAAVPVAVLAVADVGRRRNLVDERNEGQRQGVEFF